MQPCFTLRKWVSAEHENNPSEDENVQLEESNSVLQSSGMVIFLYDDMLFSDIPV